MEKKKYELIIFDLDGTILDTLADLTSSLNHALTEAGFLPRTLAEVRGFVGNGLRRVTELAVASGTDEATMAAVFNNYRAYYALHCAEETRPYAGIPEVICALRQAGRRTAVVSNKADGAVQTLCRRHFPGLFDGVVGEREGVRRKPAPDSVNEVLHRLGVPRERAVYIGDSEVDAETARNARLDCFLVDWGFRDREILLRCGALAVLSSPAELAERLL